MKTRNGFVSNSSSSSFIIGHGNIEVVASNMLNILLEDDSDWPSTELSSKLKKNLDEAIKNKNVKNGSIGITFPSCNYDIYIVKEGDKIYVSTCNNTDWSEVEYSAISKGYGADDCRDECHERVQEKRFFDLRDGTIHSCEKYFDWNTADLKCPEKDCHGGFSYIEKDGQKICSYCRKGVLEGKNKVRKIKTLNMEVTNNQLRELINGLDCAYDQGLLIYNEKIAEDLKVSLKRLLKQKYE